MDEDILRSALQTMSRLLYKHYGKKTIILIDEYDVPLDVYKRQLWVRLPVLLLVS